MRLNDIKVGPRLALSFGLVLLITAVIAAVGVWRLQDLAAATQRLTSTDNERLRAAVQWRQGIDQNWIRTRAALLNADSSHLAQWQAEMDATSKGVDVSRKTVERLLETDEGRRQIADILRRPSAVNHTVSPSESQPSILRRVPTSCRAAPTPCLTCLLGQFVVLGLCCAVDAIGARRLRRSADPAQSLT